MKTFLFFFVLFLVSLNAYPEQIIATLDITDVKGSATDPQFSNKVLVVQNTDKKEWAAIWTEDSFTQSDLIRGRLISDKGDLAAVKTLKKGAILLDADYDQDHGIYVVLQASKGISAQAFKESLVKKSKSKKLPKSFDLGAQILYDPDTKSFNAYYRTFDSSCTPTACENIHTVRLNETGKPISSPTLVLTAEDDRGIFEFGVFRNPVTKNTLLLLTDTDDVRFRDPVNILAYFVKPDGTLLNQTPLKVGSMNVTNCPSIFASSAGFDGAGPGLIGFSFSDCDNGFLQTKFRTINSTETRLGKTKKFPKGDYSNALPIAVVFDKSHNEYVVVWGEARTLKAGRINAANGKVVGDPFTLASITLRDALFDQISLSYDDASGRIIAVWLENLGDLIYQVHAVIFEK